MPPTTGDRSVLITSPGERRQAHDLLEALDGQIATVLNPTAAEPTVAVPKELADIIGKVLEVVANGGTVTIGSMPDELTTTAAAEQLGISRPTLMKMIRNGDLPARKVGSHHRIKSADVRAIKRQRLAEQRRAFDELRRLEDELDTF